jgi:hypothetical protein
MDCILSWCFCGESDNFENREERFGGEFRDGKRPAGFVVVVEDDNVYEIKREYCGALARR